MDKFPINNSLNWIYLKDRGKEDKDEIVSNLIGLLSNKPIGEEKMNFSDELEIVAKILNSVSDAVKDDTITENQANMLLKYLISGVVSKRVTGIFDNIFSKPEKSGWFIVTGRKFEAEDW